MAVLTSRARKQIPTKDFAGPGRSYPVEDAAHARAALSLGARFASPSVDAAIKRKVRAKYPGIGKK